MDEERREPGTFVQVANLFLTPAQAEALPFRVTFIGDPLMRDAELAAQRDEFSPIVTAWIQLDEGRSGEALVPSASWLSAVLGFATRAPTHAVAVVDRGPGPGGRWEEAESSIGLPRFGKRKPNPLFRMPADLRELVEAAWRLIDEEGFFNSPLPDALEWHNFARTGQGLHYLDIQLAHHWIALEVLATRWADANGFADLLNKTQISDARKSLRELAVRHALAADDTVALEGKALELGRRPMRGVVLAYLRELFAPYPAQPVGTELESLVGSCLKWRNTMVHVGSLAMHSFPREKGASGVQQVHRSVMKLEGVVGRALLAEIRAPIAYLTDVPWTKWRSGA